MPSWDQLAEARIQEWLRRPEAEKLPPPAGAGTVPPLEVQLLQDILQLYTEALAAKSAEAKARPSGGPPRRRPGSSSSSRSPTGRWRRSTSPRS